MIRFTFICLLLSAAYNTVIAQKALVLEKGSSLRTHKFFVGDQLVFKLKSYEKDWFEEYIVDIEVSEGYLILENRIVSVDQISAIQIRDGGGLARRLSSLFTKFSYSWGFWTLVSAAFGDKITTGTIGIGLGSFAVGQLFKLAFFKTFKVSDRKRLRLIDLTFYEVKPSRT
jgi:hypothetical protein